MAEIKPVTPAEAKENKLKSLPSFVIDAFNVLLSEKAGDSTTIIRKDEAIQKIVQLCNLQTDMIADEQTVINNRWLDIEELYGMYGWKVSYYRPSYDEYSRPFSEPYFEFKAK